MLKGVNKLILEINNPESEYFEKAILFVRAARGDIPNDELRAAAETLIDMSTPAGGRRRKGLSGLVKALVLFGAALTGAGVMLLWVTIVG